MKKLIQTKPIASLSNIHVQDQAALVDFLNANSKSIGAIANLGSFIDIVGIKNDIGIKVKSKFLIVERDVSEGESAGKEYKPGSGPNKKDVFDYSYNLPDVFPEKPISNDEVILPTVRNHECATEVACRVCNGSGKCDACNRVGNVTCGSCDGSGKKTVSNGRNKDGTTKHKSVACSRCDGSGRVPCSQCGGTHKCNRCEGSGNLVCDKCDGSGYYQTYSIISTTFRTVSPERTYTDIEELKDIIQATKNKVTFDDDLVEWESGAGILFDKRSDAVKTNRHFAEFSTRLESHARLSNNQRLGRVHTTFENVPITIVDYSFENKENTIYIVGENNIVCFSDIPKKHIYKAGFFTSFIEIFTRNKRQLAFLYIASYMFYSDGPMNEQEKKLLELLLSQVKLSQSDRDKFIEVSGRELSFDEIQPYLKCVQNDIRAVVFAWQCVLQDKNIEPAEVAAFNMLASYFKVSSANLEKLKLKAEKFGKLKELQLLTEYFS